MTARFTLRTLVCLLASTSSTRAQVTTTWQTTVTTSPFWTEPESITADAQGRVLVCATKHFGPDLEEEDPAPSQGILASFDAQGQQQWSVTLGSPTSYIDVRDVLFGTAGDALLVESHGVHSFDNSGGPGWVFSQSEERYTTARFDAAGNAYLIGQVVASPGMHDQPHIRVEKLAPNGAWLAQLTWVGDLNYYDEPFDAAFDTQGNLYVCGYSGHFGALLLKIDPTFHVAWARTVPGWDATARALAIGASGEVYVAATVAPGSFDPKFTVLRYEPDGTLTWSRTETEPGHEYGHALGIAVDLHGDVVAAGWWSPHVQTGDAVIVKYDTSGNRIWRQSFASVDRDRRHAFDVDAGGDVLLTSSPNVGAGYVARFDHDGHLTWTRSLTGGGSMVQHGPGASAFVASSDPTTLTLLGLESDVAPVCFGDGSGSACPCGNASPVGERAGCTNSFGNAGRLGHDGMASLSNDSLVLIGTGMPDSAALYFQGTAATNGGAGAAFGDGLRCVGGTVVRLGAVLNTGNQSQYPNGAAPSVSLKGQVGVPGVRYYQVRYRNSAAFCTSETFNMTNALRVSWVP